MNKQKGFIFGFIALFFCFLAARSIFAASIPPVIALFPLPKIYSAGDLNTYYAYNENIVYSGTWTLPPDYYAVLKYVIDGAVVAVDPPIDSFDALTTATGSFSKDFGSTITSTWNIPTDQTPGIHTAQIQTTANARCIQGPYTDTTGTLVPQCLRCVTLGNPVGCKFQVVSTTAPSTRSYNITPAPVPVLDVTPVILPPFSITEGSSQTKSFTVKNTGGAVMNGTVTILPPSGPFSCVSGCSYTVNPGLTAPDPVVIRFWPPNGTGDGPGDDPDYTANVQFTCTTCVLSSLTRTITGNSIAKIPPAIGLYWGAGQKPPAAVTGGALPGIVDFGTVSLNTPKDYSIRVQNNGGSQGGLLSGGITFAPNTGKYSCPISTACSTGCNYFGLDGGNSCDITVRFLPTVAVADNPTATFSNTVVGATGKVTQPFTGLGNDKPILEVRAAPFVTNTSCSPTTNPASCNLTTTGTFVNIGSSKLMSFEIKNVGTNIMGGAFSVAPSSDFTCFSGCGGYAGLAPGDPPVTVTVKFAPVAAGACTDPLVACSVTLSFTNKLNNNTGPLISTLSFPLWANGNNAPVYGTSGVNNFYFNMVLIGDTRTQKITTITNTGVGSMNVTITPPATDYACATPADCIFTIPAGGFHDVNFSFSPITPTTPPAWNRKTKLIVVTVDGVAGPSYTLDGWAMPPALRVNPTTDPVDFGVVNIGASSTQTYYVLNQNNDGTLYQNFGNIIPPPLPRSNDVLVTVVDSAHYTCVSGCSYTLPLSSPGPQPVVIKFLPGTDTGAIPESIQFNYESVPFPLLKNSITRNVTGYGNDQPWLAVTPLSGTDYGTVDVAVMGDGKNFVFEVKNIGVGPTVLSGSVSGLGAPFICQAGCGVYTLNPGQAANVTIRFEPTTDGYTTQNINFTGAQGVPLTLSGTGNLVRNASISLAGSYNFTPGTPMNIGDPPPVKTITLSNTGLGDWNGEISLELPFKCSPADIFGRCIYSVPAGGTRDIDLSFAPGAAGPYTSRAGFSGRTNPIAYFPFDKEDNIGSGTMRDASGNKNDGTLQGSASLTSVGGGQFGEAATFTGNGVMTIPSIPLPGSYTISTWFKYPLPGGVSWNTLTRGSSCDHQVIVASGSSLLGVYDNSFGFRSSGFSMSSLASGWHQLTAVGHGTTTDFYIDGTFRGTTPFKSSCQISYIGNYQGGGQSFGTIDEFEIFNRVITPAEVAKLALESDKSKTFNTPLLAKLRLLAVDTAEASHGFPLPGSSPTDKLGLILTGTATFNPLINLDVGSYNFGKVVVNKWKDQVFQFTNTGTGTLGPGTLSVAAPFYCIQTESDIGVISPLCSYNVTAGSFFQATISFHPTAKGIFAQDLLFSNPPGLISLPLSGEGVSPFFKFLEF
jgi:hypothetical protein